MPIQRKDGCCSSSSSASSSSRDRSMHALHTPQLNSQRHMGSWLEAGSRLPAAAAQQQTRLEQPAAAAAAAAAAAIQLSLAAAAAAGLRCSSSNRAELYV
ncbi:hypothetical protein Emag_001336 [Eimeria magna]